MTRIVTAGASPSIQKTIFFRLLELGGVNRSGAFRLDASGKAVNAARVLHQLAPALVECQSARRRKLGPLFVACRQ